MIRKVLLSASLIAAAWPGMASAAWQEAKSAHFIVYADDKPARVQAFTERLERFDKALHVARGVPDGQTTDAERVRVYMVGGLDDIRKLAGRSGVAGFYSTRVGGPVAFVPRDAPKDSPWDLDAQSILFHEYTHHFMFQNLPGAVLPAWFIEGFAEFSATATIEKDGSVKFGAVPAYRVWTVTQANLLPARRLLQLSPGKLSNEQTDALYSRGWLLLHFLTFEPTRKGQLIAYLSAINAGKSADEASQAFGDLKKLDSEMTAYVLRDKIWMSTIAASKLTIGAVTLRAMSAGEAAVMPALLQTERGVDDKSAPAVALLARKLAAPFPNDAGAQNELAEAEFDAGNYAEADAAADRARAADPQSIHALIYKGMIKSALLQKANDTNVDHWRIAQGWYAMANKLDTDNPLPMALFYRTFFDSGRKPTTNAEDGLISAYQLAPFDYGLRMNAAGILLRRGDKAGARNALLPIAYSPHRRGIANIALDAVTALDAGNVAGALAILNRGGGGEDKAAEN